jgi:Mg-chelatase subunit ChlD
MMQMKKQVMSQQQHVLQTTQIVKTEQLQSQKKVELGVDVTFLLDVSGSMAGLPAKTMASELEWFVCEAKMLQPKDTVEVLAFNDAVSQMLIPTWVHALSQKRLKDLNIAGAGSGGTRLWDAIDYAINKRKAYLDKRKADKPHGRVKATVLLVLTDGASEGSHAALMARLAGIGKEIPHFHMHVLGINLGSSAEAILNELTGANKKRVNFTNIRGGHATHAIQDSFRTHFTKTVVQSRVVESVTVIKSQAIQHGGPGGQLALGTGHQGGMHQLTQQFAQFALQAPPGPALRPSHASHHNAPAHAHAQQQPVRQQAHSQSRPPPALMSAPPAAPTHSSAAKLVPDCPYGRRCNTFAVGYKGPKCSYHHDKSTVPCLNGATCHGRASGKCPFWHL